MDLINDTFFKIMPGDHNLKKPFHFRLRYGDLKKKSIQYTSGFETAKDFFTQKWKKFVTKWTSMLTLN